MFCKNKKTTFAIMLSVMGTGFGALTTLLIFFPLEKTGFYCLDWGIRFLILLALLLLFFGISLLCLHRKQSKTLWQQGAYSLKVEYGDLMEDAFPKSAPKTKRIVVIPVNDTFDTKVEEPGPNALVSEKTIHGQFINGLVDRGCPLTFIEATIKSNLKKSKAPFKTLPKASSRTHNRLRYPLGTTIPFTAPGKQYENVYFALLAISSFDQNNNAQSSKAVIFRCLQSLKGYLDKCAQSCDVYIPLMGTGNSRANLTDEESLNLIRGYFVAFAQECHCSIHIVVNKSLKNSLSIFE